MWWETQWMYFSNDCHRCQCICSCAWSCQAWVHWRTFDATSNYFLYFKQLFWLYSIWQLQTERWRILSWPDHGDYLFMLWCGQLPILDYNGGIVLSRQRSDKDMPKKTLKEFQNLAKKFGLSWEEMCPSDNHHCAL